MQKGIRNFQNLRFFPCLYFAGISNAVVESRPRYKRGREGDEKLNQISNLFVCGQYLNFLRGTA